MEKELFCPNCKLDISQIEFECGSCKYPLSGTEKEKAIFIGKQISDRSKISSAVSGQKKVQRILYIIAAFQLLNGLMVYFRLSLVGDAIFYTILATILAVLAYLSPKKPLLYISIALGIILLYYLLLALIDINFLIQGMLWKFATISFLAYGLVQSYEAEKLKKNNVTLK
jgi:hypothetical protein